LDIVIVLLPADTSRTAVRDPAIVILRIVSSGAGTEKSRANQLSAGGTMGDSKVKSVQRFGFASSAVVV